MEISDMEISDNQNNTGSDELKLSELSGMIEYALESCINLMNNFKKALLTGLKDEIDLSLVQIQAASDELEALQYRRLTVIKQLSRSWGVQVPVDLSKMLLTVNLLLEKGFLSFDPISIKERELILKLAGVTNLCRQMAADTMDTMSLTYKLISKEFNPGHSMYNHSGKVGKNQGQRSILDTKG
ncbi:MAG: hypothetical protein JXR91_17490 [Deltaproteobacteria bacterium]|nr:hypothetical protein [Deltaproteobacteria bacterium]